MMLAIEASGGCLRASASVGAIARKADPEKLGQDEEGRSAVTVNGGSASVALFWSVN